MTVGRSAMVGCMAGLIGFSAWANCAEKHLKSLVASGELPGAVTIFQSGGREERTCLGWADVEKKVPMTEDTLFMVCSQTKGVCGVACAILIDDGKVKLDDPIEKYLPEFKNLRVRVKNADGTESLVVPATKLTLRHCLSHTGGFPYEGPVLKTYGWAAAPLRIRATVNAAVPLVRHPGVTYCYSNTGIDIAGAVVEVVTGLPFDRFLEERLFKPLGMKETWFDPPPEALAKLAVNYRLIPGKKAEPYAVHYTRKYDEKERRWPCPSAGLYSTPRDFVKFYEMLMNKGVGANGVRVLKETTVTEILGRKQTPAKVGADYSLGLNVGGGIIGHSGALQTYCEVDPEKRQLRMWMVQLRGEAGGYICESDVIDAIRAAAYEFCGLKGQLDATRQAMAESFANPPLQAAPRVWWHWMNGNVTKEGITADLESMKRIGIGGAHIFDVGCGIPAGDVAFGSDAWYDCVLWAHKEAQRLGLKLTIANCSGYSSSGGPWVKPEDSMKFVVWSEREETGPKRFEGTLAAPESKAGFYEDLAVYAVKNPKGEYRLGKEGGSTVTRTVSGKGGCRTSYRFDCPAPRTVKELSYRIESPQCWGATMIVKVQASDDAKTWRDVLFDQKVPLCYGGEHDDLVRELALPETTAKHFHVYFQVGEPSMQKVLDVELGRFARVGSLGMRTGRVRNGAHVAFREIAPEDVVAKEDVIDLTAKFDRASGKLAWDVPAGTWTILRIGDAANGEICRPASVKGVGLEVDKFSRAALERHMAAYVGKVVKLCGIDPKSDPETRTGIVSALIDSYEAGGQNWGTGFASEFAKRRGYAVTGKMMPALTGRVIGSADETARFLSDFRRTGGELFGENYADAYADLCAKYGLLAAVEPYGDQPCPNLRYAREADLPMTEFWLHPGEVKDYFEDIVQVASTAHVRGRKYVGAEAFTTEPTKAGWRQVPYDYKAQGDAVYALGVNRMIYHRFAHQPWVKPARLPGMTMGPWGTHFERTETWWEQAADWIRYQTRCQYLLQEGVFCADYVRWSGEETPETGFAERSVEERDYRHELRPAKGYVFDVCELDALEHVRRVNPDGSIVLEGASRSMHYRFVALPPRRTMSRRALKTIAKLAEMGANVVGRRPERVYGLGDGTDAELSAQAAEIWKRHPRVTEETEAEAAKRLCGAPDFLSSDASVTALHRRYAARAEGYFVASPANEAKTVTCSFRTKGRAPELWDAETGEIRKPAKWCVRDGRTEVEIAFRPAGSVFVMFFTAGAAGAAEAEPARKTIATAEAKGPWQVTFPFDWHRGAARAETLTFPALADWTKNARADVKYFSGTAEYAKTIEVPAAAKEPGARTTLDLGTVGDLAEVEVNGKKLPCLWRPPFRADITEALAGKTSCEVKVCVTNRWINRIVGDVVEYPHDCTWNVTSLAEIPEFVKKGEPSPTGRGCFYTYRHWYKSAKDDLPPSGLIGPVRVEVRK